MSLKAKFSLKQVWAAIIVFAVMVPVATLILWYGQRIYDTQLHNVITIEHQDNKLLEIQIESEIARFKTLLTNKTDAILLLLDKIDSSDELKKINNLLKLIVNREPAIHEIMILSTQGKVLADVDPGNLIFGDRILSEEELQAVASRAGFNSRYEIPEVVIPSLGRNYIGTPKVHDNKFAFTLAVPIGKPAKGMLIAVIDVDKLWFHDERNKVISKNRQTQHYILDRRGTLITEVYESKFKAGDIMTHLAIARKSLIDGEWPSDASYTGLIGQTVYGASTRIPSLSWTLITEVNASSITDPILKSVSSITVVTLLGMVVFIFLVLYLAGKTLKPIQATCDAFNQVTKGHLQISLQANAIRELDALSSGFNNMIAARLSNEKELKRSQVTLANNEAQFRGVLESTIDGVLIVDRNGQITLANKSLCDMTGYSINELIGEPVEKLVQNSYSNHSHFRENYFKNPETRLMGRGGEFNVCRKDGTFFSAEISLTPVETEQGLVVAAMVEDITTKLQVKVEKERLLQSLEEQNAELERYAFMISHDLKSPLVTIKTFLGYLQQDMAQEDQDRIEKDIDFMNKAADKMNQLLNELLEMSRLGYVVAVPEHVEWRTVVEEALNINAGAIAQSGVAVTVDDTDITLFGDRPRLVQIYQNLIDNAVKFLGDQSTPQIRIGAVHLEQGIEFYVCDNGVGVDARYHDKIFGMFEKLDNAVPGSGLGLALVKRIIQLYHGYLKIESKGIGHGTCFRFTLPTAVNKNKGTSS